jgi:hypothetical protein
MLTSNITEEFLNAKSDSVDVTIRVLDSWSTILKFLFPVPKLGRIEFEKLFFGIGHHLV